MDHVEMRQRNAAQTLEILYGASPTTMARLCRESGLSRRTLELILDDLLAERWVVELDSVVRNGRSVGRPARRFSFRYDAAFVVAIALEAGQIRAVGADLAGHVLADVEVPLPVSTPRRERLAAVRDTVSQLLTQAGIDRSAIIAVAVSTPGIVHDDGTVDLPITMPGWTGFSLSDAVSEFFDCPVHVENDAKLAALGEKWSGEEEVQDFVYVFADSQRIGIGLVLRGELYRGVNGAAGEVSWVRELGLHDLRSPLLTGFDDPSDPRHAGAHALAAAARRREPAALREVDALAKTLAPGITAIAWLLAPQEIVLGGSLGAIQDLLVPALTGVLADSDRPPVSAIRGSRFGDQSVLTGCLRMCIESVRSRLFAPAGALDRAPAAASRSE